MNEFLNERGKLLSEGYAIIEDIYSSAEINSIIDCIETRIALKPTSLRHNDLFAIRQFVKEVPEAIQLIFSPQLKSVINHIIGEDYFVVKSIYFDKPPMSNWFVAYHQDLTISVDKKVELAGYSLWTNKQNQYAVRPPQKILENIFTIRIHLDDTNEKNGALRVIPGSHLNGTDNATKVTERLCAVRRGGIMLMRPLLYHASSRTIDDKRRRVIHIEFSNLSLDAPLRWAEHCEL